MAHVDTCKIQVCMFVKKCIDNGMSVKRATEEAERETDGIPAETIRYWWKQAAKEAITEEQKVGEFSPTISTNSNESESKTNQVWEHGGKREGAGRPPKFFVQQDNSQFRTSFTGENEWFTPLEYIESARKVVGEIELDPATSDFGQDRVKALKYYTIADDGLVQPWYGKVWLNPPYSQPEIAHFSAKIVKEYQEGNVTEAIILTHNYTDTSWFHLLESVSNLICFTKGRIRFEGRNGEIAAPTQGSVFFYLGNNPSQFRKEFGKYGFIR